MLGVVVVAFVYIEKLHIDKVRAGKSDSGGVHES